MESNASTRTVPRVTFFGVDVEVVVGSENSTRHAVEAQTLLVTDDALAKPAWADAARALELLAPSAGSADSAEAGKVLSEPRSRARAVFGGRATDVFRVRALPKKNLGLEEATRKAVGAAVADWKTQGVKAARLVLATGSGGSNGTPGSADSLLKATLESLAFALYRFEYTFGNAPMKRHERALSRVTVEVCEGETGTGAAGAPLAFGNQDTLDAWVRQESSIALAWQFARWLGDRPANTLSPAALVEEVAARVTPLGVSARILDEKNLEAQGFGGILAVGKGSANPPRLGIYEYAPAGFEKTAPIVLVGKGVTFDTGGYSIKPKQHHNEMKYDMCGAAGVAAALEAIARTKLPVRVVALLACAENMVSRDAQRPGDVYRAWNGKTVDVYNTDAEGRLLLGDALAFSGTFAPSVVVDMATLTGGTLAIAGNLAAIACASDDALVREIREAGSTVGEKYLHLEILPEVIADMKGLVSDYTNMNAKWSTTAMTMHAAAFLGEFVPEGVDWLHLDIAGMAYAARDNGYAGGPGANAYGARSLFHFVAKRARSPR